MVKKLAAPEQKKEAPEPKKFIVKASGKKIPVEKAAEKVAAVPVSKKALVKAVEKKPAVA